MTLQIECCVRFRVWIRENPTRMALDVLKANLDKLAKVLDPVPVATMLYSDSLITPEAWEEAQVQGPAYGRNLKVLTALGKTVQIDEFTFDTFLMRLSEEQVYISLVEDLKGTLEISLAVHCSKT